MKCAVSIRGRARRANTRRNLGSLISALACAVPLAGTTGAAVDPPLAVEGEAAQAPVPTRPPAASVQGQAQARAAARDRLKRALKTGFGVQYWGDTHSVAGLEDAGHGLLIVEATRVGAPDSPDGEEIRFTAEEVRRISKTGIRPVIAYLELTEIEVYRDYWMRHLRGLETPEDALSAPWIGPRTDSGEQLALYWHPFWEEVLVERVERLMALGFDGIMFDDALHYFSFQSGEGLHWQGPAAAPPADGHAMAMMRLVLRLTGAMRAADPSAIAIVNNGVFIARDAAAKAGPDEAGQVFEHYAAGLDGILIESLFAPGATQTARGAVEEDFAARGISVLTIDFLTSFQPLPEDTARAILGRRASDSGFCPYVAPDEKFDRLAPPSRCNGT